MKTEINHAAMEQKSGKAAANKKSGKDKSERPDKGIETMFRITSANSQRLSVQADNKAHILITVNSIIISVLLGTIVRTLESHPAFTVPAVLLLLVNLAVITLSILATTPNIPSGTFTPHQLETKEVNLLFFGNFYKMPFNDYSKGMLQMMEDRDFLYLSLIRDVYNQGIVLGKKYKLLKYAYHIFLWGLTVSVIAFFIAAKYYN